MERASDNHVDTVLLPNIDSSTWEPMISMCNDYPERCFPMAGLHPNSVKQDYRKELELVDSWLEQYSFCAIGETGIDLYRDKTFATEQEFAFKHQIELALAHSLPVVIHTRNSFDEVYPIVYEASKRGLTGVFHCFTGNAEEAGKVVATGFKIGIGGVVTFKNSNLPGVLGSIGMEHILLETDAPFLAPAPYRGKTNESAYLRFVAMKVAAIKKLSPEEVANITTRNALELFKLPSI